MVRTTSADSNNTVKKVDYFARWRHFTTRLMLCEPFFLLPVENTTAMYTIYIAKESRQSILVFVVVYGAIMHWSINSPIYSFIHYLIHLVFCPYFHIIFQFLIYKFLILNIYSSIYFSVLIPYSFINCFIFPLVY